MSIIGKQLEVGVAIEDTRGTVESTPQKWMKNVAANVILRTEKVIDNNSRNRIEGEEGQRTVQKWLEGDIEGVLHADALGYLLRNVYGDVSTSTIVADTVYSHEFTMANDIDHPTLSIFVKDGSVNQQVYNGGVVNSLSITAATDDIVRFTSNLIAKTETSDSSTPSYDTEYDWITRDISVKIADTEAGLSGANALELKNLEINWELGAIRDHVFGSRSPDNIYNAMVSIEGSFEKNYDDNTFKDLWEGESYKYMQIFLEGEADLGSGNNPSLTILLNRVQITDWDRSGDNDELVTETVNFKAFYNASDSQQSKLTLQNVTEDYDAQYA